MALSAGTTLVIKNNRGMKLGSDTVKTAKTIYQGAMVSLVGAGTSCEPCTNDAGTALFLGIAKAYAQATETAYYYYDYEVRLPFKTAGFTAGSRLSDAYAYDDEKATENNTLGPKIGVCTEFVTSYVWVWIRGPSFGAAS